MFPGVTQAPPPPREPESRAQDLRKLETDSVGPWGLESYFSNCLREIVGLLMFYVALNSGDCLLMSVLKTGTTDYSSSWPQGRWGACEKQWVET